MSVGQHRYKDYTISRGGFQGTSDDRSDGWYVDHKGADACDRRGPGHRTLTEARAAIDERLLGEECLQERLQAEP